jgi:hypothetical protein
MLSHSQFSLGYDCAVCVCRRIYIYCTTSSLSSSLLEIFFCSTNKKKLLRFFILKCSGFVHTHTVSEFERIINKIYVCGEHPSNLKEGRDSSFYLIDYILILKYIFLCAQQQSIQQHLHEVI